jgi:CheY-like chemotaxis protein
MKKLTSKFPGLKVLIVEDNIINQEVCKDILEIMECDVTIAADGIESVKLAKEYAYELILMDIQLPGIDGYEATRQIRTNNSSPRPIMIALTASALGGDKDKSFAAGMDDYISKPMEASQLEAALLKYFQKLSQPL